MPNVAAPALLDKLLMIFSFLPGLRYLAAFILIVLVLPGCQPADDAVAVPQTITDRILEDDQFSLLRAAMNHADVGDVLKGGNLTLFAPTNAAFQQAGLATEAAITALPAERVKQILLYHLLTSPVSSTALPEGLNSIPTINQSAIYINKTGSSTVYVNNAQVTQPDLVVANGYIHVIDRLLTPATGNLLTTIQANPNLTFLAAAIRRIGATNPALAGTFDGTTSSSTLTLFAPNDEAFRADSRFGSLSAIDVADPQVLSNLLLYHTASGVVFSNQLLTGTITTMLTNSRLAVTVTNNFITVKGNRNTSQAVIREPDLTTTNGVIHVIDQVLMP